MIPASLTLPDHIRRSSTVPDRCHGPGYLEALDRETLWYDAFWRDGRVILVCPRLNNLRAEIRRARFTLDDQPAPRIALRRFKRHDILTLRAPVPPATISVALRDWTGTSAVGRAAPELFAGLNTVMHMSRDNPLDWIVDHARFLQRVHGLQALLLLDNGSDAYTPAEIEAALAPLGLARVLVFEMPFKYGPHGRKPYARTEKFLQSAAYNLMRLRFLSEARAVLVTDVDELVLTRAGSVFDAAVAARFGMVRIGGHWVHPAPGVPMPACHAAHTHVRVPTMRSPPKYCVAPGRLAGRMSWDVHGPERLPLHGPRWAHPDFTLVHCRSLTTGWRGAHRARIPEAIESFAHAADYAFLAEPPN